MRGPGQKRGHCYVNRYVKVYSRLPTTEIVVCYCTLSQKRITFPVPDDAASRRSIAFKEGNESYCVEI